MATGEIEVIEVRNGQVEMRLGNVHFVFARQENSVKIVSKFKPGAKVLDLKELWVPAALFIKACTQAAAILKGREKKKENKPSETRWFIKHIGPFTNELIARAYPTSNIQEFPNDKTKKPEKVWEVDWDFVEQLKRSKICFPTEFRLFSLEKGRKMIRDVTFLIGKRSAFRKTKIKRSTKNDPQEELF